MIESAMWMFALGATKALSDLSSTGNAGLLEKYHKSETAKNKWATNQAGHKLPNTRPDWLYLWVFVPAYEEKFLYSSTWFVLKTDFWHKVETIRFFAVLMAVMSFSSCGALWIDFVALAVCRVAGFSLTYENLKR